MVRLVAHDAKSRRQIRKGASKRKKNIDSITPDLIGTFTSDSFIIEFSNLGFLCRRKWERTSRRNRIWLGGLGSGSGHHGRKSGTLNALNMIIPRVMLFQANCEHDFHVGRGA